MADFTEDAVTERAWRLDLALAHARMNATALAGRLGITTASISEIKKGKSKAEDRWREIADITGVSARWLIDGEGDPPWVSVAPPGQPPPWATQLIAEVQALRAEVAALRRASVAQDDDHADEIEDNLQSLDR